MSYSEHKAMEGFLGLLLWAFSLVLRPYGIAAAFTYMKIWPQNGMLAGAVVGAVVFFTLLHATMFIDAFTQQIHHKTIKLIARGLFYTYLLGPAAIVGFGMLGGDSKDPNYLVALSGALLFTVISFGLYFRDTGQTQ